jgi:hypothetical protein
MPGIRYRDRIRPDDDAWPLDVKPDPRAAVQTVSGKTRLQSLNLHRPQGFAQTIDHGSRRGVMIEPVGTPVP